MNELQRRDLAHIWHPCSQMKDYEDFPPVVVDRGEGAWLIDVEGNRYLDAVSSWWVNLFGHANPRLNRALARQAEKLEHSIFCNFSHEKAIELAERITALAPKDLNRAFFADNGSSAVEIALKMSFQYHQQAGDTRRKSFISLSEGYHGETIGALSVSGLDLYGKVFSPLMFESHRASAPDCFRCPYGRKREGCDAPCFERMEALVEEKGREVCGIIVEPLVQGAAGMRIYPPSYLRKLRDLCTRERIHFIADEIAVGFGRTGRMFACEHAGVSPDLMCISKGITSGYLPLSMVLTTDEMYDAFYTDYAELKAFMDSHSYTGNALACALGCETLDIFEEDNVLVHNEGRSRLIRDLAGPLADERPFVGEFRQQGMIAALELVHPVSGESFPWQERVGYQIYRKALKKGALLRPLGNVLYFMPPYVTTDEDLTFMVKTAFQVLDEHFGY